MNAYEITITLDAERMPDGVLELIEDALCPDPTEPGHELTCPLLMMSGRPLHEDGVRTGDLGVRTSVTQSP